MKIVKVIETELKTALSTTATSITVRKLVDSNLNPVVLSDFGTFFVVVLRQNNKIEIIRCSNITQNANGSATLTIDTNGRNIPPKAPFTGSSTGKAFGTGAELMITDDPYTMSFFIQGDVDNTFSGENTFSVFPRKGGSLTPTDPEQFVTLAYLNSVLTGGGVVSSLASTVTFGENVAPGNPVYFKASDQKWWRAYANNPATCINVLLGIAQETVLANAQGVVLRDGVDATQTGMTAGADIYLTDAGGVGAAGSYVVKLGIAGATNRLIFEPKDGDREQFLNAITGMIVPYAGDSVPSGFLACDGALLNFTDYPDLLNVIGLKYGYDNGVVFTVNATTDTVEIVSHGYTDGKKFYLRSTTTLPGGLSADTPYFVINATTNNFQLALTLGGSAIDITSTGTGTHYLLQQFKTPDLRGSFPIGKGKRNIGIFNFTSADVVLDSVTVNSTNTITDLVNHSTLLGVNAIVTGEEVIPNNTVNGWVSGTKYYARRINDSQFQLHTTKQGAIDNTNLLDINSTTSGTVFSRRVSISITDSDLVTGTEVVLATTGTLPTGLSAGTYYVIANGNTNVRLAYTQADAIAGRTVAATAIGSGNSTFDANSGNNFSIAAKGGKENHRLSLAEMPSHTHGTPSNTNNGVNVNTINTTNDTSGDLVDTALPNNAMMPKGGDVAHNNMPPYVAINYIIKT